MTTFSIKATDGDFSTIAAFESNADNYWSSNSDVYHGEIQDNRNYAENNLLISFSTTPSITKYLELSAALENFPDDGVYSTNKAQVTQGGNSHVFTVSEAFTYFHHLQIYQSGNGSSDEGIRLNIAADDCLISRCIIKTNQISDQDGIYTAEFIEVSVDNCVIHCGGRGAINSQQTGSFDTVFKVDHCSIRGSPSGDANNVGIGSADTDAGFKVEQYNCLGFNFRCITFPNYGMGSSCTQANLKTTTGTNNAADDLSANMGAKTSGYDNITVTNTLPSAGTNAYLVDPFAADPNLNIVDENAFTITQNGANRIGSEPDPRQDFTFDIVGNQRSTTPNIGAFAFGDGLVSPGVTLTIGDLDHIGHQLSEADLTAPTPELVVDALAHGHELETPTLVSDSKIAADALNHAHELSEADLTTPTPLLEVNELDHGHELEAPALFWNGNALADALLHGHEIDSPLLTAALNAIVAELDHSHFIDEITLGALNPWNDYARRKPAGNGSGYAIYPATPANFELLENRARLLVEQWLPQNADGLTQCRYELYRESNLVDTVNFNQQNTVNDWEEVFDIASPLAGQYQIRSYDDPQIGSGGSGAWLYADAYRITISEEPEIGINDMIHPHIQFSCNVVTGNFLFPEDLAHAHQLEQCDIASDHLLTVAELAHAHELDALTLTGGAPLAVDALNHGHELESPTLSFPIAFPSIDELDHGHEIEQPTLSPKLNLVAVGGLNHAHQMDPCDLVIGTALGAEGLIHAHELESITFTQSAELAPDPLDHAHELSGIALNISIPVNDLSHGHELESPAVGAQSNLIVGELEHLHILDLLALFQESNIILLDLEHGHELQPIFLAYEEARPSESRSYYVRAENRTYTVRAETRTYTVR